MHKFTKALAAIGLAAVMSQSAIAENLKLGFLVKQPEEPWFQTEWKFADKAGKDLGFEVIKIVMTYTLPSLMKSPSGAAFGSVLGLMAFFYFFARLTLFCAAWIATAEYKDDPRMPGKTQP